VIGEELMKLGFLNAIVAEVCLSACRLMRAARARATSVNLQPRRPKSITADPRVSIADGHLDRYCSVATPMGCRPQALVRCRNTSRC